MTPVVRWNVGNFIASTSRINSTQGLHPQVQNKVRMRKWMGLHPLRRLHSSTSHSISLAHATILQPPDRLFSWSGSAGIVQAYAIFDNLDASLTLASTTSNPATRSLLVLFNASISESSTQESIASGSQEPEGYQFTRRRSSTKTSSFLSPHSAISSTRNMHSKLHSIR